MNVKEYKINDKNIQVNYDEYNVAKITKEVLESLIELVKCQYNNAIDDCLLVINANRAKFRADICYSDVYDEIMQLKEGGENE